MEIKDRFIKLYLTMALELAEMSYDRDTKVGAVLVKDNQIISEGWNGRASGEENECKDENGHTLPEVIHAEMNVIARCAKKGISTENTSLFLTHAPCFNCAKLIYLSGIKEIYYINDWKDISALSYLKKHNIKLTKIESI